MSVRAPLSTLLVPTDFSEIADHALRRALQLPLAPGARVHVVHVTRDGASEPDRRQVHDALGERISRASPRADLVVTSEALAGEPFVEIIRCSRRLDAELIVLGRRGERASSDASLTGSTTRRVIRKGDVPVLAVMHAVTAPYRTPIVATDLSDASRRVLDVLLRVAGDDVEAIVIVHGMHVPFEHFVTPSSATSDGSRYRRSFEHKAQAGLAALVALYEDAGVAWRPLLRHGDARTVILEEALAIEADLIALGTHGRSGVAHLLLGSVAEWVLDHAPCDVLVSHPVRFAFGLS